MPRKIRYAAPASRTARNAGSEALRIAASPRLAASVQNACPEATPTAVRTPALRPPRNVFRMVSAVS
jgi:NAD(P)H-hydrate repair Nnr-like enzyme with NAD(P)H-hydrate dehydratase domain